MPLAKLPWDTDNKPPVKPPWEDDVGSSRVIRVDEVIPPDRPPIDGDVSLIDLFIVEYVKDYHIRNAALRAQHIRPDFEGEFNSPELEAKKILDSPYGQWKIDQVMSTLDPKSPIARRHIVRNLLTEGNDPANKSLDRQKAMNSAASLQGQNVLKSEIDITAIVPIINLTANRPTRLKKNG